MRGRIRQLVAGLAMTLVLLPLDAQANLATFKADMVIVAKKERRLLVVHKDQVVRQFKVALGANPVGHKLRRGDGKTPEGAYSLSEKRPHSQFYKAIRISYPNATDRNLAAARGVDPGGDIMIHGQPNRSKVPEEFAQKLDWTRGCIAVTNKEMDQLWAMIDEGTRIVILP